MGDVDGVWCRLWSSHGRRRRHVRVGLLRLQREKNIHLLSRAVNCRMVPLDCTLFRCRLLSSVSLAVVATTMAASDAGLSPALAQCVRYTRQTYLLAGRQPLCHRHQRQYQQHPHQPHASAGVNVTIPAGSPGVNAVNAANTAGATATSANVTITADGVTINNTTIPLAVTRPGCEYSPAATPSLRQRTPQLI